MNKTIFITGASQGLGKVTAKLFAAKGWIVIATMRNPEKETELSQLSNVHLLKLDISNAKQIIDVVADAEKISPIDVLFNNAGFGLAGPLEAVTNSQLEKLINTNLLGTIFVTKAFIPFFKKRNNGTIITTTSSTAYIPYPFIAVYEATKAALENWTASMSYELGRFGIDTKTVVPGYMQTNFGNNGEFVSHPDYQEDFNKYIKVLKSEIGSISDNPEDIAMVVFEAATDNKKQINYIAGNHATKEVEWFKKEGMEVVIQTMKERFFDQK
ncbi:SDR family NAD(P)-dependent oxidoreductase [Aquimarina sp. Aq78]|uniref:SDR family NAD(P)-dependent oxidoreductase n=1 Tax=Aquimarina sp. Aq78 TaxID=1191889 RepID=UPI000D104BAC|nr:SDR family NAD(P)-dependent oxidoreductase [Aquimarina sp. Aq78]